MAAILHDLKNCRNIQHEGGWRVMQFFDKEQNPISIVVDVEKKQFFYESKDFVLLKVTEY